MSFRLGVFIEAITSRTAGDNKARATTRRAGADTNGKPAKRRATTRKPVDAPTVDASTVDGEAKAPAAHSEAIDGALV